MKCADCQWFVFAEHKGIALDYGECRRYPRIPLSADDEDEVAYSVFPVMQKDDWCGEFEQIHEGDLN